MTEEAKKQNIEMKWYIAQGWKKGFFIFTIFFVLGITVPLLLNGLKSGAAKGTVNLVAVVLTVLALGFIFRRCYNASDASMEKGIKDCGGTFEPELKDELGKEICKREAEKGECSAEFLRSKCQKTCHLYDLNKKQETAPQSENDTAQYDPNSPFFKGCYPGFKLEKGKKKFKSKFQ